jgi:TIR domain
MKHDIFISYRRPDREFVASIVRRLEARGVTCWYDTDIEGGSDWTQTTAEELTESSLLTVFFSKDSNASSQLKKELALADRLGRPVVPVLLDDVQPRGAYLNALADRNWIRLFPDPPARIEELVDHLSVLAGKSEAAIARMLPAGDAPPPAGEKPLDVAVGEFIEGVNGAMRPAPRLASAYVGRVGNEGNPIRPYNDILPFKLVDLLVLVPVWVIFGVYVWGELSKGPIDDGMKRSIPLAVTILEVLITGAYGALVFPARYYLRRRSAMSALRSYLISSAFMLAVIFIAFFGGLSQGMFKDNPMTSVANFLGAWALFTVIAFLIYGVLSGQRAIRSFQANIRKL